MRIQRKRVHYEWVVETLDGPAGDTPGTDPDILDVIHFETYAEAVEHSQGAESPYRIGLVRDEYRAAGPNDPGADLVSRWWAYVITKDGRPALQPEFGDEVSGPQLPVPRRFLDEVSCSH